jgi:hypothetical protein
MIGILASIHASPTVALSAETVVLVINGEECTWSNMQLGAVIFFEAILRSRVFWDFICRFRSIQPTTTINLVSPYLSFTLS